MGSWLAWAIASTLGFGLHAFAYRVLVEREGNLVIAQVLFPTVVMVCAATGLLLTDGTVAVSLTLFFGVASLQGLAFFLSNLARIESLRRHMPAHALYPILKLSTPVVVMLSVAVLGEKTLENDSRTTLGVILILISGFMLMSWRSQPGGDRVATAYALLAMLFSVVAIICSRFVHTQDFDVFAFIVISSLVQSVLGFGSWLFSCSVSKPSSSQSSSLSGFGYGVLLGLLSFFAFASFLYAVKQGDLARVAAVNSLYILIPMVLSLVFYRQRERELFSFKKQAAVALSILGVIFTS